MLYARIPRGLEHFGYAERVNGMKYLLKIVGNVPGRQDAGVIWGKAYDEFLTKDCGLTQSIVDRRLYYKHGPNRELALVLVCVLVDDNRIAANSKAALQRFDLSSWNALAAPARTPPDVLARLNAAANQALVQPAVQQQLRALGVRPQGGSAEELRRTLAAETLHWAEVLRAAKIAPL